MPPSIKISRPGLRHRLTRTAAAAWVARFGYGARGVVYLVIGGYAALAAFGADEPHTARGALEALFHGAVGPASLALLAAGLIAYSLWRTAQSLLDADEHGNRPGALLVRAGLLMSGLLHLSLAMFAATLAANAYGLIASDGGDSQTTGQRTAWLLAQPFGRWWVTGLGAAVVASGLAIAWKGARAGFAKWFDMANPIVRLLAPVCQFGLIARGFVLLLVGAFLIAAGVRADAGAARGLAEVLRWLQDQRPFGQWLLALTAAGLLAFGVYGLLAAVFREVQGLEPPAGALARRDR